MTILLLGFMLGLGDKLRWMLWSYLTISCGCGLFFFFGAQTQAAYIGNYCGDGRIVGSEACDDGNYNNNDGCDSNCHIEEVLLSGVIATGATTGTSTGTTTPTASYTTPIYHGKIYRAGRVVIGQRGGRDIASIFSQLASGKLDAKYALSPYFRGNLVVVYKFIAAVLTPLSSDEQENKINIFLTNIKKVNANWLTLQYNIDIVSLVEVIEGIMKKINTPTLSDLTTTKGDERNSGIIPVAKDNLIKAKILDEPTTDKGTPVLLEIDTKMAYRHIDRQFKGGFYACTNQQCNNVVQYIPSGKQIITATIVTEANEAFIDEVTLTIP